MCNCLCDLPPVLAEDYRKNCTSISSWHNFNVINKTDDKAFSGKIICYFTYFSQDCTNLEHLLEVQLYVLFAASFGSKLWESCTLTSSRHNFNILPKSSDKAQKDY